MNALNLSERTFPQLEQIQVLDDVVSLRTCTSVKTQRRGTLDLFLEPDQPSGLIGYSQDFSFMALYYDLWQSRESVLQELDDMRR